MRDVRICTRCFRWITRWFTTYKDNRPVCESCAVTEYKRNHPLTWNMVPFHQPVVKFDVPS